jgi:hypothetical protein
MLAASIPPGTWSSIKTTVMLPPGPPILPRPPRPPRPPAPPGPPGLKGSEAGRPGLPSAPGAPSGPPSPSAPVEVMVRPASSRQAIVTLGPAAPATSPRNAMVPCAPSKRSARITRSRPSRVNGPLTTNSRAASRICEPRGVDSSLMRCLRSLLRTMRSRKKTKLYAMGDLLPSGCYRGAHGRGMCAGLGARQHLANLRVGRK